MTSCVLFCAHYLTPAITSEFQRIHSAAKGIGHDALLFYDNSRNDFDPNRFAPGSFELFTRDEVATRYDMTSCSPQGRIYDGNTTFPILWFALRHPEYNHIWRIEYDVRFNGEWRDFFRAFDQNDSDLLTTTLTRQQHFPQWKWWYTARKPWYVLKKPELIRGFLPVCRLSAKACQILDSAYRQGWAGHDEVSVPTILYAKQCVIEDIGGDGEFVRQGNENRFYTNTPATRNYLAPGTFVCPPAVALPMNEVRKLYHPVK